MFVYVWLIFYSVAVGIHGIQEESILQNISNEITELKTRQNMCNAKVSQLETVVNELKQDFLELRGSQTSSKQTYDVQNHEYIDNITSNQSRQRRMATGGQVAFTAGVSSVDVTHLGDHHTIVFDKVITNVGNAYSVNSGIFQVPLNGVYVFTLTLMMKPYHGEYLDIVVDGNFINDIFTDALGQDEYVSTTKQWVLELNAGSEVWVRTSSFQNRGEIHGNMNTIFSGFLL